MQFVEVEKEKINLRTESKRFTEDKCNLYQAMNGNNLN